MKVREITYDKFPFLSELASYHLGRFCPAVHEESRWGDEAVNRGYGIRIIDSRMNSRRGYETLSWEYFKADPTGLIVESPRGMASQFNKKLRITNMPAFVEAYRDKILNE